MINLAVDFGNGYSVLTDYQRTISLKSAYLEVENQINNINLDDNIGYTFDGRHYVVGKSSAGDPEAIKTFRSEKPVVAPYIFRALMVVYQASKGLEPVNLTIIDTDPRINERAYKKGLEGKHEIHYRKEGQDHLFTVVVDSVKCVREGFGTYLAFTNQYGFPSDTPLIAVLNVGCGTLDLLIYGQGGKEKDSFTKKDFGCFNFAKKLSGMLRESKITTDNVSVEAIFDALENGNQLKYFNHKTKEVKTADISKHIKKYSVEYLQASVKSLVAEKPEYRELIGKIVCVGGLANNLPLSPDQYVTRIDNPLTANVEGLQYA